MNDGNMVIGRSVIPASPYGKIAEELSGLLLNASLTTMRSTIASRAGLTHDGKRDIYAACGYPLELGIIDYYNRYKRGDIAGRVIEAFPDACWRVFPQVWDGVKEKKSTKQVEEKPLEQIVEEEAGAVDSGLPPKQLSRGKRVKNNASGSPFAKTFGDATQPPVEEEALEPDTNIDETKFEKAWKETVKRCKLQKYLRKVDVLSGIGRYGVLFLGFDDTTDITKEVAQGANLKFVQAFKEDCAMISSLISDPTNPMYGMPSAYNLRTAQGLTNMSERLGGMPMMSDPQSFASSGLTLTNVHHTRCIHIAEDADDGEVFGRPRLEGVWNRLQDIETAVSASGETFWRSGFQRMFARIDPGEGAVFTTKDRTNFENRLEEVMHGLKDHIVGQGLDLKTLSGQTADPEKIVTTCLQLIGATRKIPYRILTGSEQGELAGSQDSDNFNAHVNARRNNYCSEVLIRPLVDRLISTGSLPAPNDGDYEIEWPDTSKENPVEQTQVTSARVNACAQYISGSVDQLIPRKAFLVDELGIEEAVADEYLAEGDRIAREDDLRAQEEQALALEQMQAGAAAAGAEGGGEKWEKAPPPFEPKGLSKEWGFEVRKVTRDAGSPKTNRSRIKGFLQRIFATSPDKPNVLGIGDEVIAKLPSGIRVNGIITGKDKEGYLVITTNEGNLVKLPMKTNEGNENSGNHSHVGRPGEVGGSAPSGSTPGGSSLSEAVVNPTIKIGDKQYRRSKGGFWMDLSRSSIVTYKPTIRKLYEAEAQTLGADSRFAGIHFAETWQEAVSQYSNFVLGDYTSDASRILKQWMVSHPEEAQKLKSANLKTHG